MESHVEESLISLVESLAKPRVLVVGDLMLDCYIWGNADRISPEAPIPILRAARREERLGGAAGVAGILRVLEAEVTLIGILGDDAAGARCKAILQERGIDSSTVVIDAGRQTTVKERYLGRAEQKHPQQVLRVDYESDRPITDETLQAVGLQIERMAGNHDIVLVSDYGKGLCQPS